MTHRQALEQVIDAEHADEVLKHRQRLRKPKVASWRTWGENRPLEPLDAGLKRILSRPKERVK